MNQWYQPGTYCVVPLSCLKDPVFTRVLNSWESHQKYWDNDLLIHNLYGFFYIWKEDGTKIFDIKGRQIYCPKGLAVVHESCIDNLKGGLCFKMPTWFEIDEKLELNLQYSIWFGHLKIKDITKSEIPF